MLSKKMEDKIKATIETLSGLINVIESSQLTIKKMFSSIDKSLSVNEKIEKAEEILNHYIKENEKAIKSTSANEHLKEATILSLSEQIEYSFHRFAKECENKQLPSIIGNRYNLESSYQTALNGDIEMCYLVAQNNTNLSSSEKLNLLEMAGSGGHPEACNELSIHYSLVKEIEENQDLSIKWSDKSYSLFSKQNHLTDEFKAYLKNNFESHPDDILENVISWAVKKQISDKSFVTNRVINNAYESVFLSFPVTTNTYSLVIQNLADNYKNGFGVAKNIEKQQQLNKLVYECHQLQNFKHTKDISQDYHRSIEKTKTIVKNILSIHP